MLKWENESPYPSCYFISSSPSFSSLLSFPTNPPHASSGGLAYIWKFCSFLALNTLLQKLTSGKEMNPWNAISVTYLSKILKPDKPFSDFEVKIKKLIKIKEYKANYIHERTSITYYKNLTGLLKEWLPFDILFHLLCIFCLFQLWHCYCASEMTFSLLYILVHQPISSMNFPLRTQQ